ncbi:unnamed protein product [Coregonus sp. 'balchen']|nr:unnamed protein product [Coregonus sp. 'balchen']
MHRSALLCSALPPQRNARHEETMDDGWRETVSVMLKICHSSYITQKPSLAIFPLSGLRSQSIHPSTQLRNLFFQFSCSFQHLFDITSSSIHLFFTHPCVLQHAVFLLILYLPSQFQHCFSNIAKPIRSFNLAFSIVSLDFPLRGSPSSFHSLTAFSVLFFRALWENAVHFWCDLQQYHQLFYQYGLDPYRLLYSTYVCSAACRSIGVEEESRGRVYTCLTPPFEELFDRVEEHTLTLFLEPWTLLTTSDTDTYQKVGVWEEARQVESEQYRQLQTLYEEARGTEGTGWALC